MAYYDITDANGTDFVCILRDHAKRSTTTLLVRASNERLARLAFNGERSLSVLSIRAKV
jgi:hypothetical protein